MNTKITIGFDAKRIVRNASGLGMYSRTLVNNIIRCNNSGDVGPAVYETCGPVNRCQRDAVCGAR